MPSPEPTTAGSQDPVSPKSSQPNGSEPVEKTTNGASPEKADIVVSEPAKDDKPTDDSDKAEVDTDSQKDNAKVDSTESDKHEPKSDEIDPKNEKEVAPSPPNDTDTTMVDADTAPVKPSRSREEDDETEHLAKRAKLETPEDSVATTPAAPASTGDVAVPNGTPRLNGLDGLERWNDEELEKQPITAYQAREYRRVLAGIKKTKGGAHFKDAVARLWPQLGEAYLARVAKPMDIGTLERTLRDDPWPTLGGFKETLALIYLNTKDFNGEHHDITQAGLGVVEAVWLKCLAISASEPTRPKQPSKHMPARHHEQRQSISQGANAGSQSSPAPPSAKPKASAPAARRAASPAAKSSGADTYAVPSNGVPTIRRASTLAEHDRPKRAIHPPKSKDIDYGKSGKKRGLKPELEFCEEVLTEIRNPRHYDINSAFLDPVDPVALDIPNYFQVIKKPMDLSTIASKLQSGEYSSPKQFLGDVDLMFRNCYTFNSPGTPVHIQGKELEKLFRLEWGKKDDWLARFAANKAAAAAEAAAARSDDDMFDDDIPPARNNDSGLDAEIHTFEEKLKQETQKLLDMYLEDSPNKALIDLQAGMLNVIQVKLLDSKSRRGHVKPDHRPSKSKSKGSRGSKASGAASSKKAGGARRSGGGGSKKKRTITEADKSLIATAINELSGNAIESAIDIIKRDTHQTENNNGELELDIDQLSHDALSKLWDLCKKNLSNFGVSPHSEPEAAPASPTGSVSGATGGRQPKPKKNKPMSAKEQEARIAHLTQVREQFRGSNVPGGSPEPMSDQAMDSDEDSDSEEE